MGCSCVVDSDVDDFAEILFAKFVTSRKKHNCHECGRDIGKGEHYYKEKSVFEGRISAHKTCYDCKSIRDNLVCSFYWGDVLEAVRDGIRDNSGNVSESCLASLSPNARSMICDIIEGIWSDDEDDL